MTKRWKSEVPWCRLNIPYKSIDHLSERLEASEAQEASNVEDDRTLIGEDNAGIGGGC